MKDEVDKFCRKYNAEVKPSHRVFRRATWVKVGTSVSLPSDVFDNIDYGDVACVNIQMPENRFRALLEHDKWVTTAGLHNNNHFNNNVGRVANLVVEHERECRIRQENPAVRAAYEKYLTLMRLVDSHYD